MKFEDLYLIPTDLVFRARDAVKSYAEFVIFDSNYEISADDIECNKYSNTIYAFDKDSENFISVYEDYCSADTLVSYSCGEMRRLLRGKLSVSMVVIRLNV